MAKTILHQLKTDGTVLDGMSYVIQCSDGSLVVIDGSMQEDAEGMYSYLRKLSGDKDPVVEAWFITHAHPDHSYCCKGVAELYSDRITVKQLIYRFPDRDFLEVKEPDCLIQVPAFENATEAFHAQRIHPEAGDTFRFGDTVFEILFTCADLPSFKEVQGQVLNDTSLVFRMYAEGQSVLFLGDVEAAGDEVLIKRYGEKLKSDVCQMAHHGYSASTSTFYRYVQPDIVLWPAREDRFEHFVRAVAASRFVATSLGVKDIYLAGHGTFRLELPIRPRVASFLPHVEPLPPIEIKAELCIPSAQEDFEWKNPLCDAWNALEWIGIDGRVFDQRLSVKSWCKLLWHKGRLFVNVRVDKKFVSNPDRVSSAHCDTARIYFSDEAITDRDLTWMDFRDTPGFYPNIKLYAEMKNYKGQKVSNVGGEGVCESSYLVNEDCYYLTACIRMGKCHAVGDFVGLDLEVAGVNEPEGTRLYHAILLSDSHLCNYYDAPAGIMFAKLI